MRFGQDINHHLAPPKRTWSSDRVRRHDEVDPVVLARPVLIIEDEGVIAWTLESMLEDMGFMTIAIAASGDDALVEARADAPGLVISDINLGADAMDGVTATAAIVAGAPAAVVFISGYASADARVRIAREVPKAVLLRKPVNAIELRNAIIAATSEDEQQSQGEGQ